MLICQVLLKGCVDLHAGYKCMVVYCVICVLMLPFLGGVWVVGGPDGEVE